MAVGKVIKISWGSTSNTGDVDTNVIAANPPSTAPATVVANLINTDGEDTGVSLVLVQRSPTFAVGTAGATDNRSYPPYFSAQDVKQVWYGQSAPEVPSIQRLAGLPAGIYKVILGATRSDGTTDGTVRQTDYAVVEGTGTGFTIYAGTGASPNGEWHGEASDWSPDGSGNLAFSATNPTAAGRYCYFGAAYIERVS